MANQRILIVDDSEFMRLSLRDSVEELGYEVAGEAENGDEAVTKYKELRPDLVTMDLVMPKAGGIDGIKGIKALDPKAKIVVVSAIDQKATLAEAIQAGASDFIVKPFEKERISSVIRKLLGD